MTGPSATGSLKGTPISMMSAPASAAAATILALASSEGSPAVMYAMSPSSLASASALNLRSILPARFSVAGLEPARALATFSPEDFELGELDIARQDFHVFVAAAG